MMTFREHRTLPQAVLGAVQCVGDFAEKLIRDERGYIDPGTGSMLFTIIIGAITAGVYALRNSVVKLRFMLSGGRLQKAASPAKPIVIFSDSKRYWNVFEPICDELEARGVEASYLTASPDDPALERRYKHITCEFIGEGNKAFAKLNMIKAGIVLSTTPSLDVFQWKRSRDVKWYVHVFHAIDDASMYRMFGLDYYDAALLAGSIQEPTIRTLEQLRGLPAKELRVVGLPHMDAMKARLDKVGPAPAHPATVLLAPSWGASSILNLYGGKVIDALLQTGYHVIVRPHPQSFVSEGELMNKLMADYPESEQLEWNRDNDNFDVLRRSDIIVSDFSGVIFDFAFVFDRPVIYTEPSYDKGPYDACWLEGDPWTIETLPNLGFELKMSNVDELGDLIDSCLDPSFNEKRESAKQAAWGNQGRAACSVADYLEAKLRELDEAGIEAS